MSSLPPREFLRHILDEIDYVERVTGTMSRDAFVTEETIRRAVVRALEIIGEAVTNLPPDLPQSEPGISWREVTGMRNRLIHGYFTVNYRIVWDVVQNDLPPLRAAVIRMLEREGGRP